MCQHQTASIQWATPLSSVWNVSKAYDIIHLTRIFKGRKPPSYEWSHSGPRHPLRRFISTLLRALIVSPIKDGDPCLPGSRSRKLGPWLSLRRLTKGDEGSFDSRADSTMNTPYGPRTMVRYISHGQCPYLETASQSLSVQPRSFLFFFGASTVLSLQPSIAQSSSNL